MAELSDQLAWLRSRVRDLDARIDSAARRPGTSSPDAVRFGKIHDGGSFVAGDNRFVIIDTGTVMGAESEGASGGEVFDTDAATYPVALYVGSNPPEVGETLLIESVAHRWVADGSTSGPGGIMIPECICTSTPTVLTMVSAVPSCAGGVMFHSDTIRWGPIPSSLASLHLGDGTNAFLGDSTFTDDGGFSFRYYLNCHVTEYDLYRVYAVSRFGIPIQDGPRYIWFTSGAGSDGNSCSPFVLANGNVYTGGDTTCSVSITG